MSKAKEVLSKFGIKESIETDLDSAIADYLDTMEDARVKVKKVFQDAFKKIQKADPKLKWVTIKIYVDGDDKLVDDVIAFYDGEQVEASECENKDIRDFGEMSYAAGECFDSGVTKFE